MENIEIDKPVSYRLEITVVSQDWYNNIGVAETTKYVDEKELNDIRKNALRDYIEFGVQNVLMVDISVYPIYMTDKYRIESIEEYERIEQHINNKDLYDKAIDAYDQYFNDSIKA